MADDKQIRERANNLLRARWQELLGPKTHVGRRARTLSAPIAVRETLRLAEFSWRSADENADQSRGERMLPDVKEECDSLLRDDRPLGRDGALQTALRGSLASNKPEASDVELLRSLSARLDADYIHLACDALTLPFAQPNPSLVFFEESLEHLAAYSRGIGWSDEGLLEIGRAAFEKHSDPTEAIRTLCASIGTGEHVFRCTVPVQLGDSKAAYFGLDDLGVTIERHGESQALRLTVAARDGWAAARLAHARASSIVGAPNVFHSVLNRADGHTIIVSSHDNSDPHSIEVPEVIERDTHNANESQVRTIIKVAARSHQDTDTLHDAVRNHQRALSIGDIESAYTLLWSSTERLCSNPKRPEPVLKTTADLLSGSMSFSKIRREVQLLAEALTPVIAGKSCVVLHDIPESLTSPARRVVPHGNVLNALVGTPEEARAFCAPFYHDVLLTQ